MERKKGLISVIVPVYNVECYIERCVNSIVNQTYGKLEIILIDDGSIDGTAQICDDLKKRDKRIKVIHKRNGGAASARNEGMKISSGEYIAFVDSDDYIALDMYESMIHDMNSEVDMVTCGTVIVSNDKRISRTVYGHSEQRCMLKGEDALSELMLVRKLSFSPCDKLIKHTLVDGLFFPEGRECEDIPFFYEVVKNSKSIVNIGKIKYFYWNRADSTSRKEFHNRRIDYVLFGRDILTDVVQNHPAIRSYAFVMYIRNIVAVMWQMQKCRQISVKNDYRYIRMKIALRRMLLMILFEKKMPKEIKYQVIQLIK